MRASLRLISLSGATLGAVVGCGDETTLDLSVGPLLDMGTRRLDFGEIEVGTTSAPRKIILSNLGSAALELDGVVPGQPFLSEAFQYDADLHAILPGSAASISVRFTPTELGAATSALIVRAREARGGIREVAVELQGRGVASQVTASKERLDFGQVVVGTRAKRTIELRNTSQFDASVEFSSNSNIEVCGAAGISAFCLAEPAGDFRVTKRMSLGAGETRQLELRFQPTVADAQDRASFTLRYCDQGEACEIDISLTGLSVEKAFSCEPRTIDFGAVNPGATTDALVTCSATANQEVNVTRAYFGPTGSPDFSQGRPFTPATLNPPTAGNPGGSLSIPLTYSPQTLGDDAGVLVVETDTGDSFRSRIEIPLQGSGGGPNVVVAPKQMNFGLTTLLAPSLRSVVVRNVGFDDLFIEVEVDSLGSGVFYSLDESGDIIPPGGHKTIEIQFAPIAEEIYETILVVTSNDEDSPRAEVKLRGAGINLPPCRYELSSDVVDLGTVELNRTGIRPFEIRNVSQSVRCLITSLGLSAESALEFELPEGELQEIFIEPGASIGVPVLFAPTTPGIYEGRIEFSVSDPDEPLGTVDLVGNADRSPLLIAPGDLFFGAIELGRSARPKKVTVYNNSASQTQITDLVLDSQPGIFSILDGPSLPVTVGPGGSFSFTVGFVAPSPRPSGYAGAVEITSIQGSQEVFHIVSLRGSAAVEAVQVDEFTQLARNEVDILFVVDDSSCSANEQQALGENFDAFVRFASSQALDYHIGVTATERGRTDGRLHPLGQPASQRIVTPRTRPSPGEVFFDNVRVGSIGGSEVVFDAAYNALTPPLTDAHNAGLLRRDAALAIVAITDEREQSQRPVDFFLDFFLSIKGVRNANLFSFSSLTGRETGCGWAQAAPRISEMARRSGGFDGDFCTLDWAQTLEDLSLPAVGFRSRFFLTNQPVIPSLEIWVDGIRIPTVESSGQVNWTYDFSTNSVNFLPLSMPSPRSMIRVEYTIEYL
ncbi:MAG: choice-of-anchor D domain-containing protein [Myxococcota bacterium]